MELSEILMAHSDGVPSESLTSRRAGIRADLDVQWRGRQAGTRARGQRRGARAQAP